MGIIVRYILRELGLTFLIGFAVFTSLLLVIGVVREVMEHHVPLIYTIQLIPFVFVQMTPISLPVTLLLTVTIFFAKMSGNNEVIALKALGIPPKTFLLPVFAIAFFVSILAVQINEWATTHGRQAINRVIYYAAEEIFLNQLRQTQRFETADRRITVFVGGVDEQRRLVAPRVMLQRESTTIEARMAEITVDFNANNLMIVFINPRVTGRIEGGSAELIVDVPLSEIMPTEDDRRASALGMNRIHQEKQNTLEQIEQQRRIIAAHQAFAATMGSVNALASTEIVEARRLIRRYQQNHDRLSVEPPRRWAAGFCSFFFVLLGAPLAIWMRKTDFFSSFFACFLPILIIYYPLFAFGLDQAKRGSLPPMSVWIANIAIGLIALWFLRKIHRY